MANVRIPELPPAISLSGTEEIEIAVPIGDPVVSHVSRRTTVRAIANLGSLAPTGNTVIVTGAGPFTVAAETAALVLDKLIASPTTINLGAVALRAGLPLTISDFANNAGDITIVGNGAETVMGFGSYVLGTGASAMFYPNVALGGWYKGN